MENVSNELILEFLRDFKSDVNRRFLEIDKRFEQVDKRFEQIHGELKELRGLIQDNKKEIDNISSYHNQISVKFTRSWAFASLFIALLSSTIVLAVDKAF